VGQQHGVDTTLPESKLHTPKPIESTESKADNKPTLALLQKYSCVACHGMTQKLVGPAFSDIAKKHAGKADYLAGKIKSGGAGVWGAIPMPPQTLSDTEARAIGTWLAAGAAK
jgi:cytochrome c